MSWSRSPALQPSDASAGAGLLQLPANGQQEPVSRHSRILWVSWHTIGSLKLGVSTPWKLADVSTGPLSALGAAVPAHHCVNLFWVLLYTKLSAQCSVHLSTWAACLGFSDTIVSCLCVCFIDSLSAPSHVPFACFHSAWLGKVGLPQCLPLGSGPLCTFL